MGALLPVVFKLLDEFVPIVMQAMASHKAATGQDATPDDIRAALRANVAATLQEADDWLARHPK